MSTLVQIHVLIDADAARATEIAHRLVSDAAFESSGPIKDFRITGVAATSAHTTPGDPASCVGVPFTPPPDPDQP